MTDARRLQQQQMDALNQQENMPRRWQSYLKGPRWAFGVDTIYEFALGCGLTVESASEHNGWFTKTVTFVVRGPQAGIKRMQRSLDKSIRKWNDG